MTIRTFKDKTTAAAFLGLPVKALEAAIRKRAKRKLEQIHNARSLDDLKVPPGNMLEELKGNRKGQHSVRINDQWRICFIWNGGDVLDVEIVDYH